jgi:hypothetical protein
MDGRASLAMTPFARHGEAMSRFSHAGILQKASAQVTKTH